MYREGEGAIYIHIDKYIEKEVDRDRDRDRDMR